MIIRGDILIDIIILILVVCLLIFAVKGTIKHFKGESSCCTGSSKTVINPQKKLENPVIGTETIKISGMHCKNCEKSIQIELNKIDGLVSHADYEEGFVKISYDREIDKEEIYKAIRKAGFEIK